MNRKELMRRNAYAFQKPGGRSALRRATRRNPRRLPCPTCRTPNRLTARDVALGHQCDTCADKAEHTWC